MGSIRPLESTAMLEAARSPVKLLVNVTVGITSPLLPA
jgi:hypothetical protein